MSGLRQFRGPPRDNNGKPTPAEDRVLWFQVGDQDSYYTSLRFNPLVTAVSAICIIAFVIWCIADDDASTDLSKQKTKITEQFTWFYVGSQDIWGVFILMLYFSKYGSMRLGEDDGKPEISNGVYFTMLFAAGVAIGLFYYGVAEPVWHYYGIAPSNNNRYSHKTEVERAQDAINLTLFHWGIHGWIVYVVVAVLLSFVAYRWKMPMTIRSCFFPLIGDRVYGIVGDFIDIISVLATMFGVCTSLGLGVMQINNAFHRLNNDIDAEDESTQVLIIWCITGMATVSVVSGLHVGIKWLSIICFGIGMFLMTAVLFLDDTWFLLNLYTQSIGYYFQHLIQLGFWCDAFTLTGVTSLDGEGSGVGFMDAWTIFYWGWWISWAPFVGMFVAKISKNRTIREVINYCLTAPLLYSFLWFSIFGGAGLRMERRALQRYCPSYGPNGCSIDCTAIAAAIAADSDPLQVLSCRGTNDMFFDVVSQPEYGLGESFMVVLSLMAIVLYFVTSSDSGSLVIDSLCANGMENPPALQRVFWALAEGACATALLTGGDNDTSLRALQTASVCSGLPYTIVLCLMCVALWRGIKMESGEYEANEFPVDLFEPLFNMKMWKDTIISAFIPPFTAHAALTESLGTPLGTVGLALCWVLTWVLCIAQTGQEGLWALGWVFYVAFASLLATARYIIRQHHNISGNICEDFFASLLCYFCVIPQLNTLAEAGLPFVASQDPETEELVSKVDKAQLVSNDTKADNLNGDESANVDIEEPVAEEPAEEPAAAAEEPAAAAEEPAVAAEEPAAAEETAAEEPAAAAAEPAADKPADDAENAAL